MMRERKKGVRTVVQKCMLAAERGSISRQSSESVSLSQLVLLCLQSLEDSMKSEENYAQIMRHEESKKDSANNKNDHDDYCNNNTDDNDDDKSDNHNYEDVSYNQNKSNDMVSESINIHTNNDNYADSYNYDNNEKKEYHTTAMEEQLCDERNRRARLAENLLEHPETYLAVLDILGNVRYSTCTSS